jgi:virulence factor Mce-like protein
MTRFFASRLRTALAGAFFAVLIVGLSVLGVAKGFGVFSTSTGITATLPEAGPALGPGSEVQYRGVLVGSLGSIHRTLHDAVLSLNLQPSQLDKIPANVTVRLVPRSVFGDLYVDLVPPTVDSGHLRAGAQLTPDTSTPTVELDQALDAGYQLLTAVQPSKLNATLTAVATALNGRGEKLGNLIEQVETYTSQVAPHTSELVHDITTVGTVGQELSHDAPDLLATLNDAISTSQTIVASQPALTALLDAGPGVADQTNALLAKNKQRLTTLVELLRPVINVLEGHQTDLVNGVTQLRAFLNGAAGALGHGPFLRVDVTPDITAADGQPYTAADCPRYGSLAGKNCPTSAKAKALVNANIDQILNDATTGSTSKPTSSDLSQQLGIAKVLLAPILSSLGVELR